MILRALFLAALVSTAPSPEARILAGESASAVLQDWCAAHGLPHLAATRTGMTRAPDETVRSALRARPGEEIAYRRVTLGCGDRTLSEADNWYLPDRLTADMNRQLETSDKPFGLVVKPLGFTRRTLGLRSRSGALEVRAVLVTATGAPFSYVVEDYSREIDGSR